MLELKFAICYRAASLPSQASNAYWLKNQRLSSNTPRTPTVFLTQQSCNNYILLPCIHVKKNGVVKEAIVLQ